MKYKELYEMNDELRLQFIRRLKESINFRKEYFSNCFYSFCKWYFPSIFSESKSAGFHKEWAKEYISGKHCLIVGFRESAKRQYLMAYIVWSIIFNKRKYIVFGAYNEQKSNKKLFDIGNQLLTNSLIIDDFGNLYPTNKKKEDKSLKKRSVSLFITNNGIQVQAISLTKDLRGDTNQNLRPDLLCLDDVDTITSVNNTELIDKNFDRMTGENMGALDSNAQIIFLGNVISNDGLVPRFKAEYEGNTQWYISRIPVIKDGKIAWDRFVLTDKERDEFKTKGIKKVSLETKQKEQGKNYDPNFLLIPNIRSGNPVFDQNEILMYPIKPYKVDKRYKDLYIYQEFTTNDFYYVGVDTAKGGQKGDYSVIVMRNQKKELVLTYKAKIEPDLLGGVLDYIVTELGYKYCLIGIENNNTGISTVDKVKDLSWSSLLYKEEVLDEITATPKWKYGFNTNTKTKPLIIEDLKMVLREKEFDCLDERAKDDYASFYYTGTSQMGALRGKHDDFVMAEAICYNMIKKDNGF